MCSRWTKLQRICRWDFYLRVKNESTETKALATVSKVHRWSRRGISEAKLSAVDGKEGERNAQSQAIREKNDLNNPIISFQSREIEESFKLIV